jgi:transcriptional regulator CBF1
MAPESTKRKRGNADQGTSRPSPSIRAVAAAAAVAAANQQADADQQAFEENLSQLIAHNVAQHDLQNGGAPTTSASPAQTAQAALTHYQVPTSFDSPSGVTGTQAGTPSHFSIDHAFPLSGLKDADQDSAAAPDTPSQTKPPVGSDEWHRIRRDNHKEGSFDTNFAEI